MPVKNHKPGCKCVACSPATRKRGQAALKKAQAEKRRKNAAEGPAPAKKTRKRKTAGAEAAPATAPKTRKTRKPKTEAAAAQTPAAAPKKRRTKKRRTNPGTPAKAQVSVRRPGLPPLGAGSVLVIVGAAKGGVDRVKAFGNQREAEAFAASLPAGATFRIATITHANR